MVPLPFSPLDGWTPPPHDQGSLRAATAESVFLLFMASPAGGPSPPWTWSGTVEVSCHNLHNVFLLSSDCFKHLADEAPQTFCHPTGQPPLQSELHRSPSRTLPRTLTNRPPPALLTLDNQNCSVSCSPHPKTYTQYTRCCTR